MGWGGSKGGMYRAELVDSNYAPKGVTSTMGDFGEIKVDVTDARNALLSFLQAGGKAALTTLYETNPTIKSEVNKLGVEAVKTVEKSAMQKAFDKFYGFYDANRTLVAVGGGAAVLGLGYYLFKKVKGKR